MAMLNNQRVYWFGRQLPQPKDPKDPKDNDNDSACISTTSCSWCPHGAYQKRHGLCPSENYVTISPPSVVGFALLSHDSALLGGFSSQGI